MVMQVIAISLLLLSIRHSMFSRPARLFLWGVVIFAVLSAADYFRKFWRKVDVEVKRRRRRELLRLERRRKIAALREARLHRESEEITGFRGTI
jgi:CDP-diacylglycerol--glycerol-3-phosphate 3-phosphatidyltransferase